MNKYVVHVCDYVMCVMSVSSVSRVYRCSGFATLSLSWHKLVSVEMKQFIMLTWQLQVDWNEINTAWGQTVLLLHSLANKMGLKFER